MDKEDVVHIYNGILLSNKNKQDHATCGNMDGPRYCHTEWNKLDTERQIPYDYHLHVGSKNKWYKWTYLQNRSRVMDIGNKCIATREWGGKMNWEIRIDIYTLLVSLMA